MLDYFACDHNIEIMSWNIKRWIFTRTHVNTLEPF